MSGCSEISNGGPGRAGHTRAAIAIVVVAVMAGLMAWSGGGGDDNERVPADPWRLVEGGEAEALPTAERVDVRAGAEPPVVNTFGAAQAPGDVHARMTAVLDSVNKHLGTSFVGALGSVPAGARADAMSRVSVDAALFWQIDEEALGVLLAQAIVDASHNAGARPGGLDAVQQRMVRSSQLRVVDERCGWVAARAGYRREALDDLLAAQDRWNGPRILDNPYYPRHQRLASFQAGYRRGESDAAPASGARLDDVPHEDGGRSDDR